MVGSPAHRDGPELRHGGVPLSLSASTSKAPVLVFSHVPATTATNTDVSHDSDAIVEADRPLRLQGSFASPTLQFRMLHAFGDPTLRLTLFFVLRPGW